MPFGVDGFPRYMKVVWRFRSMQCRSNIPPKTPANKALQNRFALLRHWGLRTPIAASLPTLKPKSLETEHTYPSHL